MDYTDKLGNPCAMVDACALSDDANEAYELFRSNFLRHYNSNKAPFGERELAFLLLANKYIFPELKLGSTKHVHRVYVQ